MIHIGAFVKNGKYFVLNSCPHFFITTWRPRRWVLWQRLNSLHSILWRLSIYAIFFVGWEGVRNCTTNILLFCAGFQRKGSRGQKIIDWNSHFVCSKLVQYCIVPFDWQLLFIIPGTTTRDSIIRDV